MRTRLKSGIDFSVMATRCCSRGKRWREAVKLTMPEKTIGTRSVAVERKAPRSAHRTELFSRYDPPASTPRTDQGAEERSAPTTFHHLRRTVFRWHRSF